MRYFVFLLVFFFCSGFIMNGEYVPNPTLDLALLKEKTTVKMFDILDGDYPNNDINIVLDDSIESSGLYNGHEIRVIDYPLIILYKILIHEIQHAVEDSTCSPEENLKAHALRSCEQNTRINDYLVIAEDLQRRGRPIEQIERYFDAKIGRYCDKTLPIMIAVCSQIKQAKQYFFNGSI